MKRKESEKIKNQKKELKVVVYNHFFFFIITGTK